MRHMFLKNQKTLIALRGLLDLLVVMTNLSAISLLVRAWASNSRIAENFFLIRRSAGARRQTEIIFKTRKLLFRHRRDGSFG